VQEVQKKLGKINALKVYRLMIDQFIYC